MEISTVRVKQYNSTYKIIVMVNGIPICITKGKKRAELIKAYIEGYGDNLSDGAIQKKIECII